MRPLSLPDGPLTVVALGAHPDDIEIGCGGLLLQLARRGGVRVAHLILTGEQARIREAQSAAEAFSPGAFVDCAGLRDGRVPQIWGDVKDVLHRWSEKFPAPDLILSPRREDAHQDHAGLGGLVSTVWRDSVILYYEIPKWDGDVGRPNTYVALAPELAAQKVRLLNENFPSQRGHDWWDDELFTSLLRLRGMECRSRYAEAFTIDKVTLAIGREA
jgi:LmbE family N-acetylglucosaminyl deacetylase